MIPWLTHEQVFPPVETALKEPNGLLAAGLTLNPRNVLEAYQQGIFPWFNPGEPVLWWSPDPRMVLQPSRFKLSRSLRQRIRRGGYEVRVNQVFSQVMRCCAEPRDGKSGTWIGNAMLEVYGCLHEDGYAHSIETWMDGELVGGLYGLAIGRVFYGESMFSRRSDASKLALAHLCRALDVCGYELIDCQMETQHLASLGAQPLARQQFVSALQTLVKLPPAGNAFLSPLPSPLDNF